MKKDWLVWVGCFLLFSVGAIWGGVPISTNFFKVDNVHDLLEIASSIATVLAVCLAAAGYNAWKSQMVATSDHELSRRVALTMLRYKFSSVRGCELTRYLVSRMRLQVGKEGTRQDLLDEVRRELKELQAICSEIRTVAFECKVMWGESVWTDFEKVFVLGSRCCSCIDSFLRWSRKESSERFKDKIARDAVDLFDDLSQWIGDNKESVERYMDDLLKPIYVEVGERLLR